VPEGLRDTLGRLLSNAFTGERRNERNVKRSEAEVDAQSQSPALLPAIALLREQILVVRREYAPQMHSSRTQHEQHGERVTDPVHDRPLVWTEPEQCSLRQSGLATLVQWNGANRRDKTVHGDFNPDVSRIDGV